MSTIKRHLVTGGLGLSFLAIGIFAAPLLTSGGSELSARWSQVSERPCYGASGPDECPYFCEYKPCCPCGE